MKFQPTRPLRGATTTHRKPLPVCFDFNPRAPCGARRSGKVVYHSQVRISTHAPLAGRDVMAILLPFILVVISTHAPLAGCDSATGEIVPSKETFQPTRPLRGATIPLRICKKPLLIFQPTRPLRGATCWWSVSASRSSNFNPRAPCGARRGGRDQRDAASKNFNPRAPCGARPVRLNLFSFLMRFQPTRPLRGATISVYANAIDALISTHAPLAGRDDGCILQCGAGHISTHAPLAGRDRQGHGTLGKRDYFNPRAPCGARQVQITLEGNKEQISTHAPLAGRDCKRVQITMHIFAITDKFQMLLHRMPPARAFCSFLMQENHADFGCEPPK